MPSFLGLRLITDISLILLSGQPHQPSQGCYEPSLSAFTQDNAFEVYAGNLFDLSMAAARQFIGAVQSAT